MTIPSNSRHSRVDPYFVLHIQPDSDVLFHIFRFLEIILIVVTMSDKLRITKRLSEKECRRYLVHGFLAQINQTESRSKIPDDIQLLVNMFLDIDRIKTTVK